MPVGVYLHKRGEQASHWVGDKVGKIGVHRWLRQEYGIPKPCEHCHRTDDGIVYDWACKNKLYRRVREDYMRLCRSCHRKYDYTFNGLEVSQETRARMALKSKGNQRARIYQKIGCTWCKEEFFPRNYTRKFCSKHCAMKGRYNLKGIN